MKYEDLEEYAKEHSIKECAEKYNCCYIGDKYAD